MRLNLFFLLQNLNQTMDTGSIAAWNVQAGDKFGAGDVFCSVETDKAVVDFEAQDEGVVAKLLVAAGTEVAVGSPVMIIVDDESSVAAFADYAAPAVVAEDAPLAPPAAAAAITSPTPAPAVAATGAVPAAPIVKATSTGGKLFASPLARKLAQEMGYDVNFILGSGPSGRILAADVKEYQPAAATAATLETGPVVPLAAAEAGRSEWTVTALTAPVAGVASGGSYTDYPTTQAARDVAARLAQSKRNVPHYYLTVDISVDALLQLRRTIHAATSANSSKTTATTTIGVYEFLIKAAALSMKTVPSANAAWMDSVVRVYDSVDANVVLGSGDSLSTLLLRDCGSQGLQTISTALSTAVSDPNHHSNNTDSMGLGTFTILNLGMYGIKSCAPIIREPQALALAIGALQNRIVPSNDENLYKECVVFTATASFDHRVVDGAVGAQWLAAFKSHVENPSTLLL